MLKAQKTHFFLLWFLVVSSCIYVGITLSLALGDFLYEHNGMSYSASNDGFFEGVLSLLLLVGLFMGFGQWVVINTKIRKASGWIVATWLGFGVGSLISYFVFAFSFPIAGKFYRVFEWIDMVGTLLGSGMFTGLCQWVSLKRKLADSFKWSAVTGASFAIGMVLVSLVEHFSREASFLIISISIGLISGIFAEPLIIAPNVQKQSVAI